MIFEIKKSINANLAFVGMREVTQTLLECMYCMQQYNSKHVIGCITDVTTWHFMRCVAVDSSDVMMSVNESTTVIAKNNNYDTLDHHLAKILLKAIEVQFVVYRVCTMYCIAGNFKW